jgi:hypothetical protein
MLEMVIEFAKRSASANCSLSVRRGGFVGIGGQAVCRGARGRDHLAHSQAAKVEPTFSLVCISYLVLRSSDAVAGRVAICLYSVCN